MYNPGYPETVACTRLSSDYGVTIPEGVIDERIRYIHCAGLNSPMTEVPVTAFEKFDFLYIREAGTGLYTAAIKANSNTEVRYYMPLDETFYYGCGSVVAAKHALRQGRDIPDQIARRLAEQTMGTDIRMSGHMLATLSAHGPHLLLYLQEVAYNSITGKSAYNGRLHEYKSGSYHSVPEYLNAIEFARATRGISNARMQLAKSVVRASQG